MIRQWAALAALVCLASCISGHDSVVADVNPAKWVYPVEIVYDNRDTTAIREAALFLRYGNGTADGVYIIELHAPSGAKARDTVAVNTAAEPRSNNLHEIQIPYRRGIRLSEEGGYLFRIVPPEGVRGIWSAGIDFKNSGERNGQE